MLETWPNVFQRKIVSLPRYFDNHNWTDIASVANDGEEDATQDGIVLQRVLVMFQGIHVDTWLRIVMLVRRALYL